MKRLRLFFFLLLWFPPFLFAQTGAGEKSVVWSISGKGIPEGSVLFGTMHLSLSEQAAVPSKVWGALKGSRTLVTEASLDMSLRQQIAIAQQLSLPRGQNLRQFMSDSAFARLCTYAYDSLHLRRRKLKRYMRLKPVLFSSALVRARFKTLFVPEEMLFREAKRRGLPNLGLERFEDQIRVIDSIPLSQQVKALEGKWNIYGDYLELTALYRLADVDSMASLSKSEEGGEMLLDHRNSKWLIKLPELLAAGPILVAVGAAHLGGPQGLVIGLRRLGYEVKPLP
jgi:uncharacterized protein YbaP (TraB family)